MDGMNIWSERFAQRPVDRRFFRSRSDFVVITRFSSVFTSNRAAAAILWQILSIIKCPRGNEAKKQEEYLRHKSCKGWKPLLRIQSFCLSHPCHCTITWLDKTSEMCRFEPRFSTFSFFSSHFYTFLFKPQELQLSIEIFWGCSAGKSVDPRCSHLYNLLMISNPIVKNMEYFSI